MEEGRKGGRMEDPSQGTACWDSLFAGRPVCAARGGERGLPECDRCLKESARRLMAEALEIEIRHARLRSVRQLRNGFHPLRLVITGIGPVPVRVPKFRPSELGRAPHYSVLVPPYSRHALVPSAERAARFKQALASGSAAEALYALLGSRASALPPSMLRELQAWWAVQCFQRRTQAFEASATHTPKLTQDDTFPTLWLAGACPKEVKA